jgi:peptidoglycan-associated lipoprotein
MKKTIITVLTLGLALGLISTGCKKKETPVTKFPAAADSGKGGTARAGQGMTGTTDQQPPIAGGTGVTSDPLAGGKPPGDLPDPNDLNNYVKDDTIFKPYTVYFEFDRATVRSSERSKIESVAKVLKEQPNTKLQVEGHCDERGTEEYNRGLGERRALGAREYLMTLGIEGSRLHTITYGKDRPAVQGHNEEAWSKNRRAEFILYRPKN